MESSGVSPYGPGRGLLHLPVRAWPPVGPGMARCYPHAALPFPFFDSSIIQCVVLLLSSTGLEFLLCYMALVQELPEAILFTQAVFSPALLLPRIFAGKCWRLTVPLSVLPIGLAASHGFAPVRIHTPIQHRRIIDFLSSPGLPAGLPGRRLLLWGPPARLFGQGFRPDGLPSLRCGLTRTTGTSKISTV